MYYCDKCHQEVYGLYTIDNMQLCNNCVIEQFDNLREGCDICGKDAYGRFYNINGKRLCENCLLDSFPTVGDI